MSFTRQLRSSGCKIVIDLDSQDESVIHLDSQNESVIDLDSQNESEQENVAQTEKPPKKKKTEQGCNATAGQGKRL